MKPAGDRLKAEFPKYEFKDGSAKLISNTDAKILETPEKVKEELYKQTFGPVKWVDVVSTLKENGVTKLYEIGPGKVLKGLLRKIDKSLDVLNVEKIEDLA
jgi:[acyl-carrier-protein] S-malonyltransferase